MDNFSLDYGYGLLNTVLPAGMRVVRVKKEKQFIGSCFFEMIDSQTKQLNAGLETAPCGTI